MIFTLIVVFIFGSCFGSFLGVLIDRLPKGETVIRGRSHCDYCKRSLKPLDLIPIVSWVRSCGRCRYCLVRLSLFYPGVEVLTGLLFASIFYYFTTLVPQYESELLFTFANIIYWWIIASGLLVILFTDLQTMIIPDAILFPLTALVLLRRLFEWSIGSVSPLPYLTSGALIFLAFLLLVVFTKGKGMGLGDVKYVFFMGVLLGYPGSIIALNIAFLTGAIYGVILLMKRKKKLGQTIPFGPFLVIGTVVVLIFSDYLSYWWMQTMGF